MLKKSGYSVHKKEMQLLGSILHGDGKFLLCGRSCVFTLLEEIYACD
jgi:hypothetical protein